MSCAPTESGLRRYLTHLFLSLAAFACTAAELPPLTDALTPIADVKTAPPLRLVDLDGKPQDLADLKGKVVLVNFWATWCPPCRREMPSLERLRERLGGQGLAILAVNVGEDEDTVFAFTGQLDPAPGYPLLLDLDTRALQRWQVRGLPTTFIVDAQGRIVYRAVGGREFDSPAMLEALGALLKQ